MITMDDFLKELNKKVPPDLKSLLNKLNGAALLVKKLPLTYKPETIASANNNQRVWELIGLFYFNNKRYWESLSIFSSLYNHMLKAQLYKNEWIHKGMPLVWIRDCLLKMNFQVIAKRYEMLTLCEDAIAGKGNIDPEKGGIYYRSVIQKGMSDSELIRYAKNIYNLSKKNEVDSLFPEWILQELDQRWMNEFPSYIEGTKYIVSKTYIKYLLSKLGDKKGNYLERLAEYILSCMPGCRTYRRKKSKSTDYDVICAIEGIEADFRSELGRYFICECKDWNKVANFSVIAKFCRVLDSVKSKFGILFSKKGISGYGKSIYAEREQIKVFQDRSMVIVVINQEEIEQIAEGANFINLLKEKYEKVRLDLK